MWHGLKKKPTIDFKLLRDLSLQLRGRWAFKTLLNFLSQICPNQKPMNRKPRCPKSREEISTNDPGAPATSKHANPSSHINAFDVVSTPPSHTHSHTRTPWANQPTRTITIKQTHTNENTTQSHTESRKSTSSQNAHKPTKTRAEAHTEICTCYWTHRSQMVKLPTWCLSNPANSLFFVTLTL